MHEYISPAADWDDIGTALWVGLKISCKSAGWLTLFSLSGSTLANVFAPRRETVVCKLLNGVSIIILSILYVARFPYYKQFHSSFNLLMFNTFNDDVYALGISLVKEFYLPIRLAGAFLLAFLLYRLFSQWLACRLLQLKFAFPLSKWFGRAAFLVLLYFGVTLANFGGSLSWATEVDWENAGVTKDSFLNEAILDDVQAVLRGYTMNSRLEACNGLNFDTGQIRSLAAQLTYKEATADNLDEYLQKKAQGPQVAKPQQIFIIISESYANWPLLEKYNDLHIADGMKGIIAEDDSDYCSTFLPNGPSTVSAVTGIVTGFADANLYLTTMPEAFVSPYSTASAPQLKKLGYQTNFWYAGPATWERIGAFTTAQGYEHFYSRGDFANATEGSVWGCDDKYLYEAVLKGVSSDQPSFNVILNVSNHSPFTVDTAKEGFDKNIVIRALPDEAKKDEALVNQLGHYWYADKMLADFIHAAKAKYPESLFIVIGDHADRYNIDKIPSMYERYGIPFIVTGKSVKKGMLPQDAAGSQIDVVPTLLEMIAPKDFIYYSLGTSLTNGNKQGVNYGFWITHDYIGKADVSHFVPEPIGNAMPALNDTALQDYINAIRSISWWRPKYGPILDEDMAANRQ
ncbi:LTA synthase family protein [Sporomusa acidovorans]